MKNFFLEFLAKLYDLVNARFVRMVLFKLIAKFDNLEHNNLRHIMKKYKGIEIGAYSYGCYKNDGTIEPGTSIGRFCSIAPGVRIGGMNHPIHWVTTHPILYDNAYGIPTDKTITVKPVIIEDDVWIGFNAVILQGVKIGKGAVVAAGSVVVKDVPAYCIVGGNPAKIIKYRFNEEDINLLLKINWCSWSLEDIKNNAQLFREPRLFIERYKVNSNKSN